ncbi:DHH phosphoesterase [Pluteus cervinus]|uniref:DHH phosphoesterase n=1 Tax=Pluteus cervinus TaxID=181527 RepID=A0ACD3BCX2_9AGAR|nr:DHH phosphoesterase [Pluteus cervinus]
MASPIRRLSTALRRSRNISTPVASAAAAPPAESTAATVAPQQAVQQFLSSAKERYLRDIAESPTKGAEWTVVMGNEAGDLDTVASSVAYAYLYAKLHNTPTIPLIQTARSDLHLRAENLQALTFSGFSSNSSDLLTIDDLPSASPFPSHKFALVDHNHLGSIFSQNNPQATIVAVVDHHADEGLYGSSATPRVITPAGSCASHVAVLFEASASKLEPKNIPVELGSLLLTAILIDTNGLKPGGKALHPDIVATRYLLPRSNLSSSISAELREALLSASSPPASGSTLAPDLGNTASDEEHQKELFGLASIKELNKVLSDKKEDVSHLSGRDLLRRDYKEYSHPINWLSPSPPEASTPVVLAGLSTVPVPLTTTVWDKPEKTLLKDADSWMAERGLTVLGVLTSFKEKEKKREGFSLGFVFGRKEKGNASAQEKKVEGKKKDKGDKNDKEKGKGKSEKEKDEKEVVKAEADDGTGKAEEKKGANTASGDKEGGKEDGQKEKEATKNESKKDDKTKTKVKVHKREMAWFIRSGTQITPELIDTFASKVFEGLEASDELKLAVHSDKKLAKLNKEKFVKVVVVPDTQSKEAPTSEVVESKNEGSSSAKAAGAEEGKTNEKEKDVGGDEEKAKDGNKEASTSKSDKKDKSKKEKDKKDKGKKQKETIQLVPVRIKVYQQGNPEATRKVTAPLLKAILEAPPPPTSAGDAGAMDTKA